MSKVNNALTLFFSLLVEAMPFLLLGVLFSSILLLFVDERKLIAALPKHPFLGALAGSLVGFLFPVCECGNVPVARRLLVQGAPSAVAVGFLLAAPTVNPIVLWATWIAFRDQPELVFLRLGFSLVVAVIVGWAFSTQPDFRPFLQLQVARSMPVPDKRPQSPNTSGGAAVNSLLNPGTYLLGQSGNTLQLDTPQAQTLVANPVLDQPFSARLQLMLDNIVQEFRELGSILIFGSAIAALIQVLAPRELILGLGQGPVTSILAMMLLAWVVSICSTVDSFFALSFASTFTSGSLLAFLVFGPMIDLKNIGLLLTIFKARAIAYLFALAGLLTFTLTLFVNLYVF